MVALSGTLSGFCRANHIKRLCLFGSHLKGTEGPQSDIDLLVEFEEGHEPGLIGIARLERELSHFFEGRRVDLRTSADLSRYFRDEVLASAEEQYAG
ncbi:MAG: nucleotidyltransferase [Deltaproteobacteria bacterium]